MLQQFNLRDYTPQGIARRQEFVNAVLLMCRKRKTRLTAEEFERLERWRAADPKNEEVFQRFTAPRSPELEQALAEVDVDLEWKKIAEKVTIALN